MNPLAVTHDADSVDDDGRINPLAGMGLTDDQYTLILQSLVNGDSFVGGVDGVGSLVASGEKRASEESGDGRNPKRSRFEILE